MTPTPAVIELVAQIQQLKLKRRAIILAHHYQDQEVQELADVVGDTVDLVHAAQRSGNEVILVCGAKFMAETVKISNPLCSVLLPDLNAGCSLVESCPPEAIRAYRRRHPSHAVIAYMHTSAEVKAESDVLCTSGNAVAVVNSIPADQPILFVPDSNLGQYLKKQTGRRNMEVWQGACIVHATFSARRLTAARLQHPDALVAAHPECSSAVLRLADFVGSSDSIVGWCSQQSVDEFIVVTDSGLRHALERQAPGRKFYFVANESCNCSECPYLRVNTQEKVLACLETLLPCIELASEVLERANTALQRMLALHLSFPPP